MLEVSRVSTILTSIWIIFGEIFHVVNPQLVIYCNPGWAFTDPTTDPGGAYQYEVELKNECLMRVGWAALEGRRALGTDERSFGYGGTGMKSNCGKFEQLGLPTWQVGIENL